jgi:hypothetical protein
LPKLFMSGCLYSTIQVSAILSTCPYLISFCATELCPHYTELRNLLCSTAFQRTVDTYTLPVCKSVAQAALQCFVGQMDNGATSYDGRCYSSYSSKVRDLFYASELLPTSDCTDTLQRMFFQLVFLLLQRWRFFLLDTIS